MSIEKINLDRCTGCGLCVETCPLDTLRLDTFQDELPPCQEACPAGVDIRGYLYLMKQDNPREANRLLREALPFPAITGRVCFHPCEMECARKEVDESVNINALERFVGDYWLTEKVKTSPRLHIAKVAIIGSGPAGLSAAYFLIRMGYGVTVFESMSELGGMLRMGIMEYRLPKNILDTQLTCLKDMGVEFKTNTTIGRDHTLKDLKDMGYKASFFATGTQLSKKLKLDGAELEGVAWGLDFLRDINLNKDVTVKDRVIVIGGGDVAMDVALTTLRLEAKEVTIACLESGEEMPSHKESIQQVIDEGINIYNSWGPKRILGENEQVTGIELIRCVSVFDTKNSFNPNFDENTIKLLETDMVILAVGQISDLSILPKTMKTTDSKNVEVDSITMETNIPGVFAGGDLVLGPSSVVEAIATGRKAAISIDHYLQGKDFRTGKVRKFDQIIKQPEEGLMKIMKKERKATPLLIMEERSGNFNEIKKVFNEEMALDEMHRCMTCGSKAYIAHPEDCMTCFTCEIQCPYEAVYVHPFKEVLPFAIEYPEEN